MKKLDIRFDTEKVEADLAKLVRETFHNKSSIARAAMNIGLATLLDGTNFDVIELIDEHSND